MSSPPGNDSIQIVEGEDESFSDDSIQIIEAMLKSSASSSSSTMASSVVTLAKESGRRASVSLWELRLKLRLKLSDLVELILMSFQVIWKSHAKKSICIPVAAAPSSRQGGEFCMSNFEDMDDFNYSLSEVKSKYRDATLLPKWKAFQTVIFNELLNLRSCVGGYTYLLEPLLWAGWFNAVLAQLLNEQLQTMGVLGCLSCIMGSIVIVIHAPQEQTPTFV
ncbi:putative magnesium transporter [Arachis hypogaea]|nr:putative magnesium transporter [Arachis hypogaea]